MLCIYLVITELLKENIPRKGIGAIGIWMGWYLWILFPHSECITLMHNDTTDLIYDFPLLRD